MPTYRPAMHALHTMLLDKTITLDNNPVARWCMANVQVDSPDKLMPKKLYGQQQNKIDCAVTLLMATLQTLTPSNEPMTDDELGLFAVETV